MTETTGYQFSHLAPAEAGLGRIFGRPKVIAAGCVIIIAGLGWFYLALLIAAPAGSWLAVMQAFCRSLPEGAWSVSAAAVTASMWGAMTLAMMLPSAAPMILTYAEIAETAARKGERIVSPLVIAAGYASVWLVFSLVATAMQIVLTRAAMTGITSASGILDGAVFIGAGVYQFSALKHACLTRCQNPFSFFFTSWATMPGRFGTVTRSSLTGPPARSASSSRRRFAREPSIQCSSRAGSPVLRSSRTCVSASR